MVSLTRLLLLLPAAVRGAEFFVAPDGRDENAGTREAPFATVQRAQAAVQPGDTVRIRGGTYQMTEANLPRRGRLYASVTLLDKDGTEAAPITYTAAAGERPVFDFTAVRPAGRRVAAFHVRASHLHIVGLEVTGVQVTVTRHTQSICFYNEGSDNIYERLAMHDGQAIGIYSTSGYRNLFLNCDAWQNYDSTSENGRGGNVDGFGCHPSPGAAGNVFRGCRAWLNSDDGFDCINSAEAVVFENCWAFRNGTNAEGRRLADGNGFKAGGYADTPAADLPRPLPRHVVQFCIAAENRSSGFYANHHPGGGDWLHNSAWNNGVNFNLLGRLADNRTDVPGTGHRLTLNLAAGGRAQVAQLDAPKCTLEGNLFDFPRQPKAADFVSLDAKQLAAPRKADGSLPDLTFLRLTPGSSLRSKDRAAVPGALP